MIYPWRQRTSRAYSWVYSPSCTLDYDACLPHMGMLVHSTASKVYFFIPEGLGLRISIGSRFLTDEPTISISSQFVVSLCIRVSCYCVAGLFVIFPYDHVLVNENIRVMSKVTSLPVPYRPSFTQQCPFPSNHKDAIDIWHSYRRNRCVSNKYFLLRDILKLWMKLLCLRVSTFKAVFIRSFIST
jgi:hypothetical protein